jgi:hypothetical protein
MSGGTSCKCGRRDAWRVRQYRHNNSTFHGGFQNSQYSGLVCLACEASWRTKAPYVEKLKHLDSAERESWLRGEWKDEHHERTPD